MHTIKEAISALQQGKMVILVDDEQRENEGDFVMPAQNITPAQVNWMITQGRGLLCAPVSNSIAQRLRLPLMTTNSTDPLGTAFTLSVDHCTTTTGISAYDRAKTLQQLANPHSCFSDFRTPGHIFPLRANSGGLTMRQGHTEAAIQLSTLAGFSPAAAICEIVDSDGKMARLPRLESLAQEWDMPLISIAALQKYLSENNSKLLIHGPATLPTPFGTFQLYSFSQNSSPITHLALVHGNPHKSSTPPLVRIHSECMTGDVFHSFRCDCGTQLHQSLQAISEEESGILLYLRQEGRGIGLDSKIKAYCLQEQGLDTVDANISLGFPSDLRNYDIAATLLKQFNIPSIRLITNNPDKIKQLEKNNIKITERVSAEVNYTKENYRYLSTKKDRMGHLLSLKKEETCIHA